MGKASRRKKDPAPGERGRAAVPAVAPAGPAEDGAAVAPWITPALLVVLAGAAIFRVVYFLQFRARSVFYEAPILDSWIYHDWARRLAAGEAAGAEPFYFAPGYPYALSLLYRIFGPQPAAAYVVQMALGLIVIVLIHRLAGLAFGRRAAGFAALLAALYASFPFLETKILSATPALALLLGAVLLLEAAARRGGAWRWAIAGVLLGLTSLVRPETLLAAPFLLLWIVRWGAPPGPLGGRWTPALIAAAALGAGWLAAIAPAAIHNVRAGGGLTLISSQGGITFYQSNNERARGLYVFLSREGFSGAPERQAEEERQIAEKALGRPVTRSEVSSYWFRRGLDWIVGNPLRAARLLGFKLLRFVGSYEYSTEYLLPVERESIPLLWIPFAPFALIVALALPSILRVAAGGTRGARREPGANAAAALLLLVVAANLATVLAFYVSSRYRLPSAPPLIVFAGATAASLAGAWRAGRRGEAWAIAAVVAAIFLLCHFEKDASATIQEANLHYNSGNILAGKKEHDRAIEEYRRAIAMDDSRYEFFYNMGNSLRDLGRFGEAAGSYREAGRRRPSSANAFIRECQMRVQAGDPVAARDACLAAERMRPEEYDVQIALARLATRDGDRDEAMRRYEAALRIRPGSREAMEERSRL